LIAIAEILEVADIFVFGKQLVEVRLRLFVFERIALQLADSLREPARYVRKLALLVFDSGLLPLEPNEGIALAVQDVLELLLHFREGVLQIEVAVALAHLLA